MLKAILLDTTPNIKYKKSIKVGEVSIKEINSAIEKLGLRYKRLDEIDIFNICNYILSKNKGS